MLYILFPLVRDNLKYSEPYFLDVQILTKGNFQKWEKKGHSDFFYLKPSLSSGSLSRSMTCKRTDIYYDTSASSWQNTLLIKSRPTE